MPSYDRHDGGGTPAAKIDFMRSFGVLLVGLLATSCGATPTGPSVPLNQLFTLAPSETAVIAGEGVTVQFVQVSGDSRCPGDALCIQGGDAVVMIRASNGRAVAATYDLHTGDSARAVAHHGHLQIALVEL